MTEYRIDERDMMFNLLECPGLRGIQELDAYPECDEDTLRMIFDQSKAFCQKVLAPLLAPSDRAGCRLENGRVSLPDGMREAWEQYRELGLIGMTADPEFGGAGLPHFFSIPVTEMECGSFVSFSMLPLLTRGAARLIWAFGDARLKALYLEKMFSGEWSGTMCLTEPGAGSDVGAGVTKAVPEGDRYKISGTKIFITWGDHELTKNVIHLVLARTPGSPPGTKGLSLFVVPKFRLDENGEAAGPNDVACGAIEHKMGINASPTCVINFGANDGAVGFLVGEENQGMRYMFQMMNEARIEVGVQGLAQASAAYLSAVDYARERVQGVIREPDGPRPAKIIEHADVRRMLIKMRALVEGSRAMIYHLMNYVDLAHGPTDEAAKYGALVDLMTPICKSFCSDQGFRVSEMAVQTYGGYGYTQDYPVEQYLRDVKIASIYEGTNGIQAMDLVFRKILMNKGENLQVWAGEARALCESLANTKLEGEAEALGKAAERVMNTVAHFGQAMQQGGEEKVRFYATEFQDCMGYVMSAYFLLRQSRVAQDALAGAPDDRDRRYYEQKLATTAYYFNDLLPGAIHGLDLMAKSDAPGLNAAF